MDSSPLQNEARVLGATLASLKPLNTLSLLLSAICALLLLFAPTEAAKWLAGAGLIAGLLQSYFNWRVTLDRALIPLLVQLGTEAFDHALAPLFPQKAGHLSERDIPSRMAGARALFRRQCSWLVIQLGCASGAVGLHLAANIV